MEFLIAAITQQHLCGREELVFAVSTTAGTCDVRGLEGRPLFEKVIEEGTYALYSSGQAPTFLVEKDLALLFPEGIRFVRTSPDILRYIPAD